jgi:metal-responsive CopG/Arc/MetJ family transcriptional regulator
MATIKREKTDILSVSLPKDLRKEVIAFAKKNDMSVSQFVKQALKGAIFMSEWEDLRRAFRPAAIKLGIKSDEDVERIFG